jgi:hypothetical protein
MAKSELEELSSTESNKTLKAFTQTKVDENTKLCSFDIENMYTDVPVTDVKNIIK